MLNLSSSSQTPSMARSWPCAWLRILAVLCMVLHVLNAVEYEAKPALFDVGAAHHSIFSLELSDDDLRMLVRAMDEQVMLLKEKLANPNGVQRSRRGTLANLISNVLHNHTFK